MTEKASIKTRIERTERFLRNARNSKSPFRFGLIELLGKSLEKLKQKQRASQ